MLNDAIIYYLSFGGNIPPPPEPSSKTKVEKKPEGEEEPEVGVEDMEEVILCDLRMTC